MMFPWADGSKPVNEQWHKFRQDARAHSFDIDEFSENDQIKYDLDTADIDGGKYNDRSYTVNRVINTPEDLPNGTDVRTLEDR